MEPENAEPTEPRESKLTYEAPRILETETFETLALACGLTAGPVCLAGGGQRMS